MTGTNNDFRNYLDERFKNLHNQLDNIKRQAEKTQEDVQEIISQITEIKLNEVNRYLSCPNTKEIAKLRLDYQEVMFFKSHWKVFALSFVLFIGGTLITGGEMYRKYKTELEFLYEKNNNQKKELLRQEKQINSNNNNEQP